MQPNLGEKLEQGAPAAPVAEDVSSAVEPQAPGLTPEQALELVAEGQRMLGQGRAKEALALASSVLDSDPDHLAALALKGDSLEKLGEVPAALSVYERILEIKPDSAMDRIRATHLRRLASATDLEVEEPPAQARALMAAGAVFVLLVAIAGGFYYFSQGSKTTQVAMKEQSEPLVSHFPGVAPVPTGPDATGQAQQGSSQPLGSPAPTQTPTGQPGFVAPPRTSPGSRAVNVSPSPTEEVQPVNPLPNGMPPLQVRPSGGGGTQPAPSNPTEAPVQPAPTAPRGPQPTADDPVRIGATSQPRPGIVDIRPSGPAPARSSGGSVPINDDEEDLQSATALVRVARDAYVRGDFSRAADAYERALRLGASRGSTNQRLAQCYERLGRKGDAIAAYERAIAAYQSQLSAGEDNARISAALDSTRQALKVLRGS